MSVGAALKPAAAIKSFKTEYRFWKKKINLLFCIIEATPDSHVAWLWYSKRHKEITELVSIKSQTRCTHLFVFFLFYSQIICNIPLKYSVLTRSIFFVRMCCLNITSWILTSSVYVWILIKLAWKQSWLSTL